MKQATVLFADLVGFSEASRVAGIERAHAAVTHAAALLDECARRHGGAVDKYLGDALLAVFGVPIETERHAARALAAALEMHELVAELRAGLPRDVPFGLKVGVNSGSVAVGDVGGRVVREFAVMGDAVNVAARLKERAAPGETVVGEETRRQAGDAFRFADGAALQLRGRRAQVTAHRLVGPSAGVRRGAPGSDALERTRCVGRAGERAALAARWGLLADGAGGLVRIEGAAGAGKSRLLAAASADAPLPAASLVELRGPELGRLAPEIAKLVEQSREAPMLVAVEQAERVARAAEPLLGRLLDAARRGPLLLVLLVRTGGGALDCPLPEVDPDRGDLLVRLGALAPADAHAMAAELAAAHALEPEELAAAVARAAGNPRALVQAVSMAGVLAAERARAGEATAQPRDTEHRRATVLFADLSGFTALSEAMDPRLAQPLVAECLARLEDVARLHGGVVEKLLGDCVLATFGVPVALEDAPVAAINAAIEMRAAVAAFNAEQRLAAPLRVHTGIETGYGIAGELPGPIVREYALMGDAVHMASRLRDLSPPGEIWVGPTAHRETRHRFRFSPVEPLAVPSGPPTPVHRVDSEAPQLHREREGRALRAPLAGRRAELDRLTDHVARLAHGVGSVVGLVGPAGLGKTRLLEELRAGAGERALWLQGRSLAVGHGRAYQPFEDLLASWLAHAAGRPGWAALAEALAGLDPEGERDDLLPYLALLLEIEPPEPWRARLAALEAGAIERLTRRAVRRWLERLARRRPLVLVFEDVHWADGSSIELLLSLLDLPASAPVLFLLAARPHHAETSDRVLEEAARRAPAHSEALRLVPLAEQDLREMLRALFRDGEVPRRFRDSLAAKAAGNPLFVEEAIRALLDEGRLMLRDGTLEPMGDLAAEAVPGSVHEVVMARIDRLPRPARSLLLSAAVIGGRFESAILRAVADASDFDAALRLLVQREFLEPEDAAGDALRFRHPLLQEVAYGSLLETRRVALHRAVGEAIERSGDARPGTDARLAYHFGRAGELARAEPYLFRAGDEAARSAASNEALAFFRQALEHYVRLQGGRADPARRARLESHIAQALHNRGQLAEATRHFDAALAHLGVASPARPAALAAAGARDLAGILRRLVRPPRSGRRPAASDREREILDLMFRRNIVHSTTDAVRFFADSLATLHRLLRFDPVSVPESAAIVAGGISIFSFSGVSFAVGRRLLALSEQLASQGGVSERLLYQRFLIFLHHLLAGDWSDAHALTRAEIDASLAVGQVWELTTFLDLDAERRIYRGDFATAERWIAEIRRIARDFQHELADSAAAAEQAFLHLERRELGPARAAIARHYEDHSDVPVQLVSLGTRAKIECLDGALDEAARLLARAEALRRAGGPVAPFHASGVARSQLLLDALRLVEAQRGGRPTTSALRAARRSGRRARALAKRVASRRPEVWRLSGRVEWLAGHRERAMRAWTVAARHADRLGARPERARLDAEVGLCLHEAGDRALRLEGLAADALLQRARAAFDALALAADHARLDGGGAW